MRVLKSNPTIFTTKFDFCHSPQKVQPGYYRSVGPIHWQELRAGLSAQNKCKLVKRFPGTKVYPRQMHRRTFILVLSCCFRAYWLVRNFGKPLAGNIDYAKSMEIIGKTGEKCQNKPFVRHCDHSFTLKGLDTRNPLQIPIFICHSTPFMSRSIRRLLECRAVQSGKDKESNS